MTNEELLEKIYEKLEQQNKIIEQLKSQIEGLRSGHVFDHLRYKHLKDEEDSTYNNEPKEEIAARVTDNVQVKSDEIVAAEMLPRKKYLFESEDEYINYLCDYCKENYKNIEIPEGVLPASYERKVMNILEQEENTLSTAEILEMDELAERLGDDENNVSTEHNFDIPNEYVYKPELEGEEFVDISKLTKEEIRDISSDSSKLSNVTLSDEKSIKADNPDFVVLEPDEKSRDNESSKVDYKKDKGSKTKKIGKVRKSLKKIKEFFKKNSKIKAIAGLLVGTIGLSGAVAYNAFNNKDNNKDDEVKVVVDEYKDNIPSEIAADSLGVSSNDLLNKFGQPESKFSNIDDEIIVDDNSNYDVSDEKFDIHIGDPVDFTGNSLYETSDNAKNKVNPLTPYNSNDDDRVASLVQYMGPNGEVATAYNQEDQKLFEEKGWTPIAVNFKNNSQSNDTYVLNYEGWANLEDVKRK